jgi:hypothetical protein
MRPTRDVSIFVGSAIAYSIGLSLLAWSLPRLFGYKPSDSLIVISVASAILAARGAPYRRKLLYAGVVLGGFVLVDFALTASGFLGWVAGGYGVGVVRTAIGVLYDVFAYGFPLVVLVVFVGRDVSVLWVKPLKKGRPSKPRRSA